MKSKVLEWGGRGEGGRGALHYYTLRFEKNYSSFWPDEIILIGLVQNVSFFFFFVVVVVPMISFLCSAHGR
jgi:hypothetical protein